MQGMYHNEVQKPHRKNKTGLLFSYKKGERKKRQTESRYYGTYLPYASTKIISATDTTSMLLLRFLEKI